MAKLDLSDLQAVLDDERHEGWGYATRASVPSEARRGALDEAVVEVANECGLDREQLFVWTNSKWGRWLIDCTFGLDERSLVAAVRKYMSTSIVETLCREEVLS